MFEGHKHQWRDENSTIFRPFVFIRFSHSLTLRIASLRWANHRRRNTRCMKRKSIEKEVYMLFMVRFFCKILSFRAKYLPNGHKKNGKLGQPTSRFFVISSEFVETHFEFKAQHWPSRSKNACENRRMKRMSDTTFL